MRAFHIFPLEMWGVVMYAMSVKIWDKEQIMKRRIITLVLALCMVLSLCGCGKTGCVEQYCSATGIVRLAKKALAVYEGASELSRFEPLTCKDIFDCGKAGDELALKVLDQYFALLGEFLGNICNVVDPDAIVLGGGVSKAGQMLLDGTRPYFDKAVFHAARGVRFELASLGNDAGAYGAFKLALDTFSK